MKTSYRRFQSTIANGDTLPVNVYGRFLTILENSSSTDLEWSIGGQGFNPIPKGISIELYDEDSNSFFDMIEIRNSTGAAATITFAISAGRITDNRVVISTTTVLLVNETGGTFTTPVKVTAITAAATLAVAAASTTREVGITNGGANPVWAGDVNVDGANIRGLLIPSGQTMFLTTAGAIYVRSTGGSSDCGIGILAT